MRGNQFYNTICDADKVEKKLLDLSRSRNLLVNEQRNIGENYIGIGNNFISVPVVNHFRLEEYRKELIDYIDSIPQKIDNVDNLPYFNDGTEELTSANPEIHHLLFDLLHSRGLDMSQSDMRYDSLFYKMEYCWWDDKKYLNSDGTRVKSLNKHWGRWTNEEIERYWWHFSNNAHITATKYPPETDQNMWWNVETMKNHPIYKFNTELMREFEREIEQEQKQDKEKDEHKCVFCNIEPLEFWESADYKDIRPTQKRHLCKYTRSFHIGAKIGWNDDEKFYAAEENENERILRQITSHLKQFEE